MIHEYDFDREREPLFDHPERPRKPQPHIEERLIFNEAQESAIEDMRDFLNERMEEQGE